MNKVVYVTSQCPFNNKEIWAIREINSLIESGVETLIVPRTGSGKALQEEARKLLKRTIATPFVNVSIILALLKKILISPVHTFRLIKWIFLQSNSFMDVLKGLLVFPKSIYIASMLKNENIKHIHAFSTTSVAVVSYILAQELKVPWSITFHASWTINDSFRKSINSYISSVSFIRVISTEVNTCLKMFVDEKYHTKIITIHIGVVCKDDMKMQKKKPDSFVIASTGWLLPHKGIDVSLNAVKILLNKGYSNFKWKFYGVGELLVELKQLAVDLEITDNIEFAGMIDNNELLRYYENKEVDIYVSNSVKRFGIQEGIPVSIMEAMSFGIPVIATNCGGTIELVDNNSGILIEQDSQLQTAMSIIKLIDDYQECLNQGIKGKRKINDEFDSKNISYEMKHLFFNTSRY